MFEAFYGFSERPFSKTPDPRFLYLGRVHREALARLAYAVEEREFILLTGGIGCGKTTLSRALMDELDESYRLFPFINPCLNPMEFLRLLALRLDIAEPSLLKADLLEQIGSELYGLYQQDICPVLIVDEAQLVSRETFDEIRLLTNFQLDDRNLLSLVLMGQPELRQRLQQQAFEPLVQRIGMQCHLTPFSLEETAEYLDHRMAVAGGQTGLFLPGAIAAIHRFTNGIPRRINHVATLALLEGFGREAAHIDLDIVDAITPELELISCMGQAS
jgi:type II secretory pathway predicted ATPase ExeA